MEFRAARPRRPGQPLEIESVAPGALQPGDGTASPRRGAATSCEVTFAA
jgi:hypothetical protein